LPPVQIVTAEPASHATRFRELFQGRYLARTLLVWVIWASDYIVAYGLQSWIPTLYREVYHLSLQQSLSYAAWTPAGSVAGSLLCALLIDRTGRRRWFAGSFVLLAAGLIELATYGAATAEGMLVGYFFCSMWTGSMSMAIFLYTAEIYPTRMRSIGVSCASAWLRIAATVGPVLVGYVLPRWGISGVFGMLAASAVIGSIAALFMIETRLRVLEEVSP
jgi:MFS transporter, putative metabolite:H+ symporter